MTFKPGAIPTEFMGIRFRSRLEAKWAALFQSFVWDWLYEPFDCSGYIPDFLLRGRRDILVEVKPILLWDEEAEEALSAKVPNLGADHLLVGVRPEPAGALNTARFPAIGSIRRHGQGTWHGCYITLRHELYPFRKHFGLIINEVNLIDPGCSDPHPPTPGIIEHLWSEACNETQWRRAAD